MKVLTVENETLKAEVEMYRREFKKAADPDVEAPGGKNGTPLAGEGGGGGGQDDGNDNDDYFVKSGDGGFPCVDEVTVPDLHGISNPLCCALSENDAVLATGGADMHLSLCSWGGVPVAAKKAPPSRDAAVAASGSFDGDDVKEREADAAAAATGNSNFKSADYCTRICCDAPVIATAFSSAMKDVVAAGCMDGSCRLVRYGPKGYGEDAAPASSGGAAVGRSSNLVAEDALLHLNSSVGGSGNWGTPGCEGGEGEDESPASTTITGSGSWGGDSSKSGGSTAAVAAAPPRSLKKHGKYVRNVAWSATYPVLATASADGTVNVYKFREERSDVDLSMQISDYEEFSLHLPGSVEALCFAGDQLLCYARGTPHITYFDLNRDFYLSKVNLNTNFDGAAGVNAFDEHVSFCVMDMKPFQDDRYVALATDASRNIVLDLRAGGRQVRNLYGHKNDGYSQPKVAWSSSGQYLYGNSQDDRCVVVWDIASSQIVSRLEGHSHPIRDIYASSTSDTVVTTAYDKQTKFWFAAS